MKAAPSLFERNEREQTLRPPGDEDGTEDMFVEAKLWHVSALEKLFINRWP